MLTSEAIEAERLMATARWEQLLAAGRIILAQQWERDMTPGTIERMAIYRNS